MEVINVYPEYDGKGYEKIYTSIHFHTGRCMMPN